jgi:enoyl-CoA hydratase/carnithine racemase
MERLRLIEEQCDSTLKLSVSSGKLTVYFNRPSQLNGFNVEMVDAMTEAVILHSDKELVLTGTGSKAFTAGGDVIVLLDLPQKVAPFFGNLFKLLHRLRHMKTDRMCILKGFVLGGGTGFSQACSIRVATDSTVWATPENSFGFFPDIGVSYHLSRLSPEGLGLYLFLTGHRLNGAEAYKVGLATHYIKDEDSESLLRLTETMSVRAAADCLHSEPPTDNCDFQADHSLVMNDLVEIEACFGGANSVEEIYQRLVIRGSDWARAALVEMDTQCPLSLAVRYTQVSLKAFNLARRRTYKQCLESDFNLVVQLLLHRNINYLTGARHKFRAKLKTLPQWTPPHISQIDDALLEAIFRNEEGPWLVIDTSSYLA